MFNLSDRQIVKFSNAAHLLTARTANYDTSNVSYTQKLQLFTNIM